jgi:hypothetical protein
MNFMGSLSGWVPGFPWAKKTPPEPPRTGGAFSNRRHEKDRRLYPQMKRMKREA